MDAGHWLFVIRTAIMALAASHGVREFYEFLTIPDLTEAVRSPTAVGRSLSRLSRLESLSYRRLGVQAWLDAAMILGEAILVLKWWPHLPPSDESMETSVKILLFTVVIMMVSVWLFLIFFKHPKRDCYSPRSFKIQKMGSSEFKKKIK